MVEGSVVASAGNHDRVVGQETGIVRLGSRKDIDGETRVANPVRDVGRALVLVRRRQCAAPLRGRCVFRIGPVVDNQNVTLAGYNVVGITTAEMYDIPSWKAAGYFALVSLQTSAEEQEMVPHHLIDILDISQAIDVFKYESYSVKTSFDTPCSHQTILTRDSSVILLTDNVVEATYPDLQTAENLLIPPLIYTPEGEAEVLLIGRTEFGVAQLADSLPGLHITAIDPRKRLTAGLVDIIPSHGGIFRVESDAARFVTRIS